MRFTLNEHFKLEDIMKKRFLSFTLAMLMQQPYGFIL
jgi:hypothetical protein